MPNSAKVYTCLVSAVGALAIGSALWDPSWPHDLLRFSTYFALSLIAAALKLRLPGLTGTMSIGFVFVLLGISEFTIAETMLMACAGVIVQCLWRPRHRPRAVQVIFSVAAVATSVAAAYRCADLVRWRGYADSVSLVLAVATGVYFTANSLLISGVLSLVQNKPLRSIWEQCYLLSFPYYLVGGAVAGLMTASSRQIGWKPSLTILPIMSLTFLFYRIYLARLAMEPVAAAIVQPPACKLKGA